MDAQSLYATIGCFIVPAFVLAFIFRQFAVQVERRALQAEQEMSAMRAHAEAAPASAPAAGD